MRKDGLVGVLKHLKCNNRPVTIIISSGKNCCELSGCIGQIVSDNYVTLINDNNACTRTYIAIDCICAVIDNG